MKKKILLALGSLFILVGAALIIVPQISNQIGIQIAHNTVNDFINLKENIVDGTKPKPTEGTETDATFIEDNSATENETVLYRVDIDRLYADSKKYNEMLKLNQQNLLIDELSYQNPSLNLLDYGIMELPIYLGATDYNMAFGAAHLTYTSLPIGGKSTNSVLSGHTGYIGRIFFDYIRNLNIGDEVIVENYWDKLTYKVIDREIYKNYQSSACYLTEGKDLLTMLTLCDM